MLHIITIVMINLMLILYMIKYTFKKNNRISVRKTLTKMKDCNIIISDEQMFSIMEVYIIWLTKIS